MVVHYKSDETVNFCGFSGFGCATTSPITVFINFRFLHLLLSVSALYKPRLVAAGSVIPLPEELRKNHAARSLQSFVVIFDEHLTSSDQICALFQYCYSQICQLLCIRPYLDHKTASTIAISIVHSKLDYCNSLYYDLPDYKLNHLQLIQNLARAVLNASKSPM